MKKRITRSFVAMGLIALLAAILSGCSTGKPGPAGKYGIEVTLDDSLKTSSVIVDLVGVNPSNLSRWEAYGMGKYWKEGDPMRRDADKVVLNFVSGGQMMEILANTELINNQLDGWQRCGGCDRAWNLQSSRFFQKRPLRLRGCLPHGARPRAARLRRRPRR